MPLIQGGPPEWIYERTPHPMKFQLVPSKALEGHTVYELKMHCGLDIMRLQFFTPEELHALNAEIAASIPEADSARGRYHE